MRGAVCCRTAAAALLATGCDCRSATASTLTPASDQAASVAGLTLWMTGGAGVIWLLVMSLAALALRHRAGPQVLPRLPLLIGLFGVLLPTVVLAALLAYSLPMLRSDSAPAPALRIEVVGERWWWRIRYQAADGSPVELANEIRLPEGMTAEFLLSSPEVIHSFWIPSLGPKLDMIPGRSTRLLITPTRLGSFRGVCAEFCGLAHAQMAFAVEVMEPAAFQQWLAAQAAPTTVATSPAFAANGCGGCHAIRGSEHRGSIGPDLTHVGSRLSLGAGASPADVPALHRWLAATNRIKPGVRMPAYGMLSAAELAELAAYLDQLE